MKFNDELTGLIGLAIGAAVMAWLRRVSLSIGTILCVKLSGKDGAGEMALRKRCFSKPRSWSVKACSHAL